MSCVPRTGAGGFLHQAPKHQLFGASPGPLAQAGHEVIASDPPRVGGCSCIGSYRWPSSWAPCAVAREWQADGGGPLPIWGPPSSSAIHVSDPHAKLPQSATLSSATTVPVLPGFS